MMTLEEKCDMYDRADELKNQGKTEEAEQLENQIPIAPHIAKAIKEVYGVDYIIQHRYNLSEAEAVYGKDWLNR